MIDKVTGDSIAAQPKRWHVGRVDRVDHLFGADDDRQGDGRVYPPTAQLKGWDIGRVDRVDRLFGFDYDAL